MSSHTQKQTNPGCLSITKRGGYTLAAIAAMMLMYWAGIKESTAWFCFFMLVMFACFAMVGRVNNQPEKNPPVKEAKSNDDEEALRLFIAELFTCAVGVWMNVRRSIIKRVSRRKLVAATGRSIETDIPFGEQ